MKELFRKELFDKDSYLYISIIVIILIYGFGVVLPPIVSKMITQRAQITEVSNKLIDLQKKKEETNAPKPESTVRTNLPISIFKSSLPTTDFEGAGMELVYNLLKIISTTGNKITEISMTPTPKAAGSPAGTLNVSMSLDCTYVSIQNLLQQVSTWTYLAEVKSISLEPVPNNTNKLNAKLSIDLYVDQ